MKSNNIILLLVSLMIMLSVLLSGCSSSPEPTQVAENSSMKGWELYSWQDTRGEWKYTLLVGTNRFKSLNEVKNESDAMTSRQLVDRLCKLPAEESVYWGSLVSDETTGESIYLPLPPSEELNIILAQAVACEVDLVILD